MEHGTWTFTSLQTTQSVLQYLPHIYPFTHALHTASRGHHEMCQAHQEKGLEVEFPVLGHFDTLSDVPGSIHSSSSVIVTVFMIPLCTVSTVKTKRQVLHIL